MVIRSILTQTEISFFAKVYGIGLVSNFEPLEGGSENSNYVLETMKGKYILTISEDVGLDQLSNLVHLYDHLNENQFPTSIIMRGLDGKSITDYKGKPAILKNFIKGTIVKNPSPQILFQIGVLAAKLHKIPLTKGIQDKFPYGISHFHQAQSWDINNSFINWLKKKAEFLANNLRTDLPKGLVHGDIFGDNLISVLRKSAYTSPSKKLADLLNGLATTINSGGDLSSFFKERAKNLLFEYRIYQEKDTRSAETFMDIYISVVIAAPMIFMLLMIMIQISGFGVSLSISAITLIMILGVTIINIVFLTFLHLKQSQE